MFLLYNNHNHVINIILNKKLLYKFLYNIFNKKLKILKNYFDKNFAFDYNAKRNNILSSRR